MTYQSPSWLMPQNTFPLSSIPGRNHLMGTHQHPRSLWHVTVCQVEQGIHRNLPFHCPQRCFTDIVWKEWSDFLTLIRMKAWMMVGLETGKTETAQVPRWVQEGELGFQQSVDQAQAKDDLVPGQVWRLEFQDEGGSLQGHEHRFRQESAH